jgi:hypothetical protein
MAPARPEIRPLPARRLNLSTRSGVSRCDHTEGLVYMNDIATWLNPVLALVSIAFGAIGWAAPRYTLSVLDLRPGETTMGLSEMRAASGALFVGLGAGAFALGSPTAYAMIGFAWGFAALGRLTSIVADGPASRQKWTFFAVEAVVGALLVGLNL